MQASARGRQARGKLKFAQQPPPPQNPLEWFGQIFKPKDEQPAASSKTLASSSSAPVIPALGLAKMATAAAAPPSEENPMEKIGAWFQEVLTPRGEAKAKEEAAAKEDEEMEGEENGEEKKEKGENGETKPRNPRHFETIEGGRDSLSDTFCTKTIVFPT